MFRFLLGVGVGAALVYFFDAEHGAERRTQANEWARQYINSDTIEQARQTTMSQARSLGQQLSQQAGVVSERVGQYRASRRDTTTREPQPIPVGAFDSASAGEDI